MSYYKLTINGMTYAYDMLMNRKTHDYDMTVNELIYEII